MREEAIVKQEETAVATTSGGLKNEAGMDIKIPFVSIVAKTGKLADAFPKNVGEYVYDRMVLVGESMEGYVLDFAPYWLERRPDKDDQGKEITYEDMPRTFQTLEEANSADLLDDYAKSGSVVMAAAVSLMLAIPEGHALTSWSSFKVGKESFVAARFDVKASSYTSAGTTIDTMRNIGPLKDCTYALRLKFGSELKSRGNNSWYVPNIMAGEKISDAVKQEIESLFPNLK